MLLKMEIEGKEYCLKVVPNNPTGYNKKDLRNLEKWISFFKKHGVSAKVSEEE